MKNKLTLIALIGIFCIFSFNSFAQDDEYVVKEENKTEEVVEEVEASVAEEVVESAVENAEVEKETVPVSSPAEEPSITEKYSKAFSIENFDIKF